MKYTPTIGLEVHAELKTLSKMFCGCKNNPHESEPNVHTCPICLAHPGSLPAPNEEAITKVLLFGKAVDAVTANYSEFDRKNYFYPDIPKAYQISQYAFPFLTGGKLKGVELTRVHLEEDTARSIHDKGQGSLVDFNRAGVPLMELVTEPVIHDAETAGNFARELQLLLRTIGISDANMERGEMRVEANISVSSTEEFGTKVEVKNLNSFKSVEAAINYEVKRQIEVLEKGEKLVQETRGWDENNQKTFSQRSKETAKDYRYFPDPDISKISVPEHEPFSPTRLDEIMPILPNNKRDIYKNLGLPSDVVEVIINDLALDKTFSETLNLDVESRTEFAKLAANYVATDLSALRTSGDFDLLDLNIDYFKELLDLLIANKIGSRVAKDLLPSLFSSEKSPLQIATEKNLLQISDESSLFEVVNEVIMSNPDVVAEYKSGKESTIKFFVGQGMKATRGSANPELLEKIFLKALKD